MDDRNRTPDSHSVDQDQPQIEDGQLDPLTSLFRLIGQIIKRIQDQRLLFSLAIVLVLGAFALFGTRLLSSDLRFIVVAIIFVVLLVTIGDFIRRDSQTSEPDTRRPDIPSASPDVQDEPPAFEPKLVRRPWVAVLDLENRSGNDEDEPRCFGVSNYLREILHSIPKDKYKIGVVPDSMLMGFERHTDRHEIRSRTGARFMLEGSLDLRNEPGVFEVALRRTVDEDSLIWEETFIEPWENVQSITREIAATLSEEIIKRTAGLDDEQRKERIRQVRAEITEYPDRSIAEFEAYNRGLYKQRLFNNLRLDADFREASGQLHRAATLSDKPYTEALVQLGFLYILRWETNGDSKWLEDSEERWLEILDEKPDHPFALAELAYVGFVRGSKEAPEAIELANRAVKLHPEHAIANNVLALLYLYLGYYETNVTIEESEVFHRAPFYVYPRTNAALAQQLRGLHQDALALADQALEIEPKAFVAHLLAGAQFFYMNRYHDADRAWAEGLKHCPEPVAGMLEVPRAWIRAKDGDLEAARTTLETYKDAPWLTGPYGPYYISLAALAGQEGLAIALLKEEMTFARSYRYLISEPTLEPLKPHPQFRSLLDERYEEWKRNLAELKAGLRTQPDRRLPSPQEFLDQ